MLGMELLKVLQTIPVILEANIPFLVFAFSKRWAFERGRGSQTASDFSRMLEISTGLGIGSRVPWSDSRLGGGGEGGAYK